MNDIKESFYKLLSYIQKEDYKGYDPYDTLLSWFPFHWFGKWGPVLAIQIQKRNPLNIRPLLGIKKKYNPKAMGLFLQAFSILSAKSDNEEFIIKANFFYNWLKENYTKGYSGHCWGYNFPWASPVKYLQPFTPSAVVTGFVCKGLWQYYKITQKKDVAEIILNASKFIQNDLPIYSDETGICISYTPVVQDICYNASLLAGEIMAMNYALTGDITIKKKCFDIVNFVLARQKEDGSWNYSQNIETGKERSQIDFHQGYILESIYEIKTLLNVCDDKWELALQKGLRFYYENQFYKNGRSLWRLPKKYPVEIHNQSQGIITFYKLRAYNAEYESFARTVASWSIKNMQSEKGYFYYHKYRFFINKISYMRWSQAWMFLALSHLID